MKTHSTRRVRPTAPLFQRFFNLYGFRLTLASNARDVLAAAEKLGPVRADSICDLELGLGGAAAMNYPVMFGCQTVAAVVGGGIVSRLGYGDVLSGSAALKILAAGLFPGPMAKSRLRHFAC